MFRDASTLIDNAERFSPPVAHIRFVSIWSASRILWIPTSLIADCGLALKLANACLDCVMGETLVIDHGTLALALRVRIPITINHISSYVHKHTSTSPSIFFPLPSYLRM